MAERRDDYLTAEVVLAGEIKRLREKHGWSQADLAARLRDHGVEYASQATASRMEKLQRHVSAAEADALAFIFGVSTQELLRPTEDDRFLQLMEESLAQVRQRVGEVRKLIDGLTGLIESLDEAINKAEGVVAEKDDDPRAAKLRVVLRELRRHQKTALQLASVR
jgi:transcriptional regulator with XRE-family HTH domain